jgi:phosphatidylserine/phosphatidylglycerophosphate/cardiolipin synthase-like enzyme
MTDRLTPAALLVTLCVSACSTTAVESTPPAHAQAPAIVALFSPTSVTGESIRDETIRRIDRTARTLDLATYTFNEPTLTEALIRANARGVSMRVIMDALQAGGSTSQSDELRKAGVTVKLMRGIKGNGIMHHKVAIYDGSIVQTGSFNWTDNASCCFR